MNLQAIHILDKHISQYENPISMCAYMGNCQPGHQPDRDGEYQQGGYQWRTFYDCEARTWKVERSEGVFECVGELNIYLDKWYHKKKIYPVRLFFDENHKTVRIK